MKAIERGEEVVITYRGKPKARIIPISDSKNRKIDLQSHPAFGMWKDNDKVKDIDKYIRTIRKGRYR